MDDMIRENNMINFRIKLNSDSIFFIEVFLLIPKNKNIHIKLLNETIKFIKIFDEKLNIDVKKHKNMNKKAIFLYSILNFCGSWNIVCKEINIPQMNVNPFM